MEDLVSINTRMQTQNVQIPSTAIEKNNADLNSSVQKLQDLSICWRFFSQVETIGGFAVIWKTYQSVIQFSLTET